MLDVHVGCSIALNDSSVGSSCVKTSQCFSGSQRVDQERLARADILTVGLKDEGVRWSEPEHSVGSADEDLRDRTAWKMRKDMHYIGLYIYIDYIYIDLYIYKKATTK